MNSKLLLCGAVSALLAVSACGTVTVERNLNKAARGNGQSDAFQEALRSEYLNFAKAENGRYDFSDSNLFARKAIDAANGKVVGPELLADWSLPADKRGELAAARASFIQALQGGAAKADPLGLAKAQVAFDCWVEEQEENRQPQDIAACRNGFESAMSAVKVAMAPAPAPAPKIIVKAPPQPAPLPPVVTIAFDYDSAKLGPDAVHTLDQVKQLLKSEKLGLSVTGYADRAGSEDYNLGLSQRRVDAVIAQLLAGGIDQKQIDFAVKGERSLPVATDDGTQEPRNRIVRISFQR